MAYLRFKTELAIPIGNIKANPTVAEIKAQLPAEVALHLKDYIREVRRAKKYAVKINEGRPDEELTIEAQWHICRHDEGNKCEQTIDI